MRKIGQIVFVVVILVLSGVGTRCLCAQIGVAAGLNYEEISDLEIGNTKGTFDNASGYHIGVFYDLGVGPAGIRTGLFYRSMGKFDASLPGIVKDFDLSLFEIPVDFRFNLSATPVLTPYVIFGPVFSFPFSSDNDFKDAFEQVSVSGNVGVGLAMNLLGLRIFPEFRYTIGISRFMKKDLSIGSVNFEAAEPQRLNTVMLRIGVGL
ncbi:MAG: outer membrane beta-barrel protein [Bacteroidetes bacterium]|nr:outer membrane beta-barrel protein [Bacteroidota bacterium]